MKYNIYAKEELNVNELQLLVENKFKQLVISTSPEIVFTFGGDGTFLDAVHKFGLNVKYIAVNMGTLGFYTSWTINSLDEINLDKLDIVYVNCLDVVFYKNSIKCSEFCVNEITVINPIKTQVLDVYINDKKFEQFRGTGVCISTPTGSTAYNKSLGGAIISSTKSLFQLVHIAAINNSHYRSIENPMIFSDEENITLITDKINFQHSILTIDRKTYKLDQIEKICISLCKSKLGIAVKNDNDFYERVKKSFLY